MEDKISSLLENYGLDKKEIEIYLKLVEKKELNAYSLAKITGIHRSTTYAVLERLIIKGFISSVNKENKTFYSALEPTKIISKVKEKESILLSLIPEFEKVKEEGISKVRVLESKESQKQFNFNLFSQIKDRKVKEVLIIGAGPSGEINQKEDYHEDLSTRLFTENLLNELKKKKQSKDIKLKAIWNSKFKGSKILSLISKLGHNKFLKDLPTLTTTVIFGEYTAYLFTMDKKPQVIEIQNKLIAQENKAYFNYIWKIAEN